MIRPLMAEDADGVHHLYGTVFGTGQLRLWEARWDWQFKQAPGSAQYPSLFWVAELGGEITGFLAAFPGRVMVQGELVSFHYPCDLMVAPSARGHRLGEKLIKSYIAAERQLVNAMAYSPSAGRIYERLGYAAVMIAPVLVRPYRLRRADRLSLVERAGALLVDVAAALRRSLPQTRGRPDIAVSHSDPAQLVERVASLWELCKSAYTVITVRDPEFIDWRFNRDPLREYDVFEAHDTAGQLVGYAVTTTFERRGLKVGHLVDLLTVPRDSALVHALLARGLIPFYEKTGVDAVFAQGFHHTIRAAARQWLFFSRQSLSTPARLIWQGNPAIESVIYDPDSWHVTYADGDDFMSY